MPLHSTVKNRTIDIDGVTIFYREVGPEDAPVVLLRKYHPPTLIVWGPQDGYMPEGAARTYLPDLPEAELHLVDGGHWALETNLNEIVALSHDFLERVHG
jgi:pimeloyl-ACP methyl ester carboxylesterase